MNKRLVTEQIGNNSERLNHNDKLQILLEDFANRDLSKFIQDERIIRLHGINVNQGFLSALWGDFDDDEKDTLWVYYKNNFDGDTIRLSGSIKNRIISKLQNSYLVRRLLDHLEIPDFGGGFSSMDFFQELQGLNPIELMLILQGLGFYNDSHIKKNDTANDVVATLLNS